VADWPRWISVGSTANCEITGAAGLGLSTGRSGVGSGGGGGATTFFLQPAANITSKMAAQIATICRLLNMNLPPEI
jgi:hypothetical protein